LRELTCCGSFLQSAFRNPVRVRHWPNPSDWRTGLAPALAARALRYYPVLAAASTAAILPIYRIDPYRLNESQIPFHMYLEYSFSHIRIDADSDLSENVCMKTTVNIPDKVLRDAMRHTKAKTKREAIVKALEEMNRRHSQAELLKYTGKFESLMTNEEIEALDEEDWKSWTKTSKTYSFSRKKK
jgi:Arc/MetJ family transcription regulator